MHRFQTLRRLLAVVAGALLVAGLLNGGSALAAHAAVTAEAHSPARARSAAATAQPKLTTNTNAPCNAPQPKGYARCLAIVRTPSDHLITPDTSGPPAGALGPADIQSAYDLPPGGGQTVAVVDAGDDASAESDLAAFRAQYGLPPCTTANGCFTKVNQEGQQGNYPPDAGWGLEISLDLDAVSSACPGCNILLVEANTASVADLGASVNEAVALGAKFISNSYGATEYSGEQADGQSYYDHPGVAVTASTGDTGNVVEFPSADPNVVSAGGTTLTQDSSVPRGWDETVWGSGTAGAEGGGSGCSQYEPQPAFQGSIPALDAACPDNRATADLSADANPASGLAVYDTDGESGWEQVGGTSLASPLIASMYALAGTPAAGTYPVSYPYQDPDQSTDLNDITQGTNGACGTVLCTAGPGWDGPTGLGSPDGVKALQGAPQGVITGQVTDASTGQPIAGARVTASPGSDGTSTGANGDYTLSGLAPGSYTLTATAYAYSPATQTGVQVTAGQSTTASLTLNPVPSATVSGTVTDGSGHGWPMYAQITIDGYPGGPIYTSPYTGKYSVLLASGTYTAQVTPAYPSLTASSGDGYQTLDQQITVGTGASTQNFALEVDKTTCTAPGYGQDGLSEDFTGWTGATPRDHWTVTGQGWRFDDPGNQDPPPGGDDDFAIADSGSTASAINTTLESPPADLSGQSAPVLDFDTTYYGAPRGETATVGLSTDGGKIWTTVWRQSTGNAAGQVAVRVPSAANQASVLVRFRYTGHRAWWWAVDNVFLGTRKCVPVSGGLVAGLVTGADATPIDGATITSSATRQQPGLSLATGDPNLPDGFYWLFAPASRQRFTATAAGYATATASVRVTPNAVTRHDWSLTPGS